MRCECSQGYTHTHAHSQPQWQHLSCGNCCIQSALCATKSIRRAYIELPADARHRWRWVCDEIIQWHAERPRNLPDWFIWFSFWTEFRTGYCAMGISDDCRLVTNSPFPIFHLCLSDVGHFLRLYDSLGQQNADMHFHYDSNPSWMNETRDLSKNKCLVHYSLIVCCSSF